MALVLGASAVGAAHVRADLPCQDAFRVTTSDGSVVVAVADGLGSASRSDIGAATAVEAAVARAAEVAGDPCRAAVEGVVAAREALEKLAVGEDHDLADLACTLMVAVARERVGIAHIGDGAVVGMSQDRPFLLSPPADTEYVNEVDPLTSADWIGLVRPVSCVDSIDALALFTDGCHHAALRKGSAHAGFFGPLFAYARGGVDAQAGSRAVADLLGGKKMGEHSDDDKTLVLVVLRMEQSDSTVRMEQSDSTVRMERSDSTVRMERSDST